MPRLLVEREAAEGAAEAVAAGAAGVARGGAAGAADADAEEAGAVVFPVAGAAAEVFKTAAQKALLELENDGRLMSSMFDGG